MNNTWTKSCRRYAYLLLVLPYFNLAWPALGTPSTVPTSDSWTKETWGGNSEMYVNADIQIKKLLASSNNSTYIVANFKRKAQANPTDALATFCWADAYFLSTAADANYEQVASINSALQIPTSPNVYIYDRLSYLFGIYVDRSDSNLAALGRRLLAHSPKDVILLRHVGLSCQSSEEGLALVQDAVALNTKDPVSYWYLWTIYFTLWGEHGFNLDYGQKTILACENYLKYSDRSSVKPRSDARMTIQDIEYYEKHGKFMTQ